jgi:rhodanese-related sulfurtransferase
MSAASVLQWLRGARSAAIEPAALRDRIERGEGLTIVDVRGPEEFHGPLGHIAGALNIPLAELGHSLARLEPAMNAGVVVVCRTDRRSTAAAALLRSAGFGGVEVLLGGMEIWNRLGFPVTRVRG